MKPGRPPRPPGARELLVILTQALIDKARTLGHGNASQGIRKALNRAHFPKPAPVAQSQEHTK